MAGDPIILCGDRQHEWGFLGEFAAIISASTWSIYIIITANKSSGEPSGLSQLVSIESLRIFRGNAPDDKKLVDIDMLNFSEFETEEERLAVFFVYLVSRMRNWCATDLRDKIYCTRALITWNDNSNVNSLPSPDYTKTVSQVYIEATWHLLRHCRRPTVLSLLEDRSVRKTPGLPLWVPDYDVVMNPLPFMYTVDHNATRSWDYLIRKSWKLLPCPRVNVQR